GRLRVHTQTGPGDPPQTGQAALPVRPVLQLNDQALVLLAGLIVVPTDVTLPLENVGDIGFELGMRQHDPVVIGRARVPQTCQKVCDRVGHRHGDLSTFLALVPAAARRGPVANLEWWSLITSLTC